MSTPPVDVDKTLAVFGALVEERGPTVRQLAAALGLMSTNTAALRFGHLERAGYIERIPPLPTQTHATHNWRLTEAGRARLRELVAEATV